MSPRFKRMLVTRSTKTPNYAITIVGLAIEEVTSFKLLGVVTVT